MATVAFWAHFTDNHLRQAFKPSHPIFSTHETKSRLGEYLRTHTGGVKRDFPASLLDEELWDRRFKMELTNTDWEKASLFHRTGLTRRDDFLVKMVNRLGMPTIVRQQIFSGLFDGFPFRVSHSNSRLGDLFHFYRQQMRL